MSLAYPPCINCGNVDFEDENGILVCTNCGRLQEGGAQQTGEDDEHFAPGKVTKRKLDRSKTKTSSIYRGNKAYRLYLQSWQHILWKQVYALCHGELKLPGELWTVVKDLWTLMVSRLVNRLDTANSRTTSTDVGDYAVNLDMVEVMNETDATTNEVKQQRFSPKLLETISLIYIACVLLHLPLSVHKLHALVLTEVIPFIRAIRHVPYEMSSKLPSEYQFALDTTTVPSARDIHQNIFRVVDELHDDFSISLPALNWRPLMAMHVRDLGLPIEIYPAVQCIAVIAGFNFSYQTRAKQDLSSQSLKSKGRRRTSPLAWPEIQLLCLIVIATKLLFPPTLQVSSTITGFQLSWPAWLAAAQKHRSSVIDRDNNKNSSEKFTSPVQVLSKDLEDASPTDIDTYLAWYEKTWTLADEALIDKKTQLEREIINTFSQPTSSLSSASATAAAAAAVTEIPPPPPSRPTLTSTTRRLSNSDPQLFQSTVQSTALLHHQLANLTTSPAAQHQYPLYPTVDTLSSQNHVSTFHSLAAYQAATDLPHLLRAIRAAERILEQWSAGQRREDGFVRGGDGNVDQLESAGSEEDELDLTGDGSL